MSWVKKHDTAKGSMAQFWHPIRNSKRNQARQAADIDMDVDSYRKTEMKDLNSEEGDTEKYLMNLCGGAEPKPHTSEP